MEKNGLVKGLNIIFLLKILLILLLFLLSLKNPVPVEKKPNDWIYKGPKKTISFVKIDLNILNHLSDLEVGMNIKNRGPILYVNYPPLGQKMYPIGMP
jgi:hypothetical protein